MTESGAVTISDQFIATLCELGRLWAEGEFQFKNHGELVAWAAGKTIADPEGNPTTIPLTLKETHFLFNELSWQVLKLTIEIGRSAQILELNPDKLALNQGLTDEVIECIGAHASIDLEQADDLDPFVIKQFVETVRARLLLFRPNEIEHCYHIAMLAFGFFKDSSAYAQLKEIVDDMF